MASWMVHLRIADRLLTEIPGLSETEFIVGSIAPDSGVPNEDWSAYVPDKEVSHFKRKKPDGGKSIDTAAFTRKYFTAEQQRVYSRKQHSFYLGYLVHLLTDILWTDNIFAPTAETDSRECVSDHKGFIEKVKADWYDLDYLYLRKHPDFRAFRVYQDAVGFVNTYMDEFSADAFDNRRAYITDFYLQENDHLDREYPYLTEAEMDAFVENSATEILNCLNGYCKQ